MGRAKKRNKKKEDTQGVLYLTLAILILLSLVASYFFLKTDQIDRDAVSLCRKDGVIKTDNVIIIDATDSFNETQSLLAKKELFSIVENSSVDSRFSLYVINTDLTDKKPIIEVCNPGDGTNKSELTSNKRRLYQQWKEQFHDKIIHHLDELIDINVANSSPIMETIKYASINSLFNSRARNKKLIILSDLLQHSISYSQYSKADNFEQFSNRPISSLLIPSLEGVEVEVLYLYRLKDTGRQNRKHITFWERFFAKSGGILTRVKKLS
ncbi:hypothetical protein BG00_12845 [Pseudoalteromonas sp. SCSIO_11900]|uniref:hypothetical protein n=1 Tax=Pseudoalteromonas sp. SCSIO_11900 TaxID=1461766 RepID=UPI00044AE798|nr:hypothetical protein [Pseudoalteromonas sp. SCSIO_11900]EWS97940.1 hypothetical protein BG00_12845 [Pseudoalteromonas sp. SCSIO_11900]